MTAKTNHTPIDRVPTPGETVMFRRFMPAHNAWEVERMTIVEPPANIAASNIVYFVKESGQLSCIIAKFADGKFNTFLFWD